MRKRRARPTDEAADRPYLAVIVDEMANERGGAFYARSGDRAAIVLSPSLDGVDYESALGHELVHDELGIVRPPATGAMMEKAEAIVRRVTAEWMVPAAALEILVTEREQWEPVTAAVVACEFEVTVDVAQRALELLAVQRL